MLYPWLTPLLAAAACSALATFVLIRGPRTELSKVFCLAGAVLASFNLFYFALYYIQDYATAFYFARIFRVGTFLTTPVGVHLAVALRPQRSPIWNRALAINYAIATIFIIANVFDVFVDGLIRIPWGFTTSRTSFYEVLTAYTVVNATTAIGLVIYQYKTATAPRTVLQSKFWMLGVTAGISLGLTNFLPAYGVPIYPLGHFGSVAFAGILAYAIVRHRLMGVDVAITKATAYVLASALVVVPGGGASVLIQRAIFGKASSEITAGLLLIVIASCAIFPRARSWIEGSLEANLFRSARRGREALEGFARNTVRIIEEEQLVAQLCGVLHQVFALESVEVYLKPTLLPFLRLRTSVGEIVPPEDIPILHPVSAWLNSRGEPVLASEVDTIQDLEARKSVHAYFSERNWNVCVPLIGSHGIIGLVALGQRANNEAFVQQDLEALDLLSAQAAIAFENARLYEELRRSQEIIDRAGRLSALGTFAAGIAHEVRNPLVSIQTFFQLAPKKLHDDEFVSSFLPLAEQELMRIRRLINELLSFARSPTVTIQPVSVKDVVDRGLTLLRPHAREHRVVFEATLDAKLDIVNADSEQLMQVFINLLLNAVEASPENGVIQVSVRTVSRGEGEFVYVAIEDQGTGIPIELRESIFNPFFTTKDCGTGLGLSIAHRIVTDCGGDISIGKAAIGGASITVTIPLAVRQELVHVSDIQKHKVA